MDILCHALESWTARPTTATAQGAAEPRAYCGANPIGDMWSEKAMILLATSFRAPSIAGRRSGARQSRSPRLSQMGSAMPVCTSRTERLPDRRPRQGLPSQGLSRRRADGAARNGGVADGAQGVPVHLRGVAGAPRAAAQLLAPDADRPNDDSDYLPAVLSELMRDISIPNGIAAVGYDAGDVDGLVEGTLKQQRLLATAPREVTPTTSQASCTAPWSLVTAALVEALRRQGVGDVDGSTLARALYSTDASLYRVVPQVVVRPRHVDEIAATVAVARESGTPLTMRGAGTSIAGNAVGTGIVVDTSRHLNRVVEVDPEARKAVVQPGTVHATLQRAAAQHGLRFGPDPSTHTRCTVGGMVGNNACGSRALGYGRTSDNVLGLDVLTATGRGFGSAPNDRPRRCSTVSTRSWTRGSRRCAPSSVASRARCRATHWIGCCRRTAATPPASWSAARGRSPSSRRPPCGWSRMRRHAPSRCSATRTCSRRPTPCRVCCVTRWWRARASTPASCRWCGVPGRRCPSCLVAAAGCSPR